MPTATYVKVLAAKGVVLAAGDFINDEEMVSVFCPHLAKNVNNFSNKYCTGDGHKMAMWVGADMDQIVAGDVFPGQTITGRNMHPADPFYALYMDWWWCPAVASMPMLYVDIAGYRYANENLPFQQNAVAALGMPEGRAWALWDGAWQTKFPMIPEKTPASRNTPEQLEIDLTEGITFKADTLEELAAHRSTRRSITSWRRSPGTTNCAPRATTTTASKSPPGCSRSTRRRTTRPASALRSRVPAGA